MLQLPFFHATVFFSDVFFSYGTYNKTKDLTKLRGPPPPLRQPHNDPYYCFTSRWHLFLTTPPVLFPPFWFLVGLISLVTTVFCIQYIFFFSDNINLNQFDLSFFGISDVLPHKCWAKTFVCQIQANICLSKRNFF